MKHHEIENPLLIAQVEPPQEEECGDYYYRTHSPGIAMSEEDGVYVVNLMNQHRKKEEIIGRADIVILKNICDPDLLPVIRERKKRGKLTVYEIADDVNALQPWNSVYSFYKNKENLALIYRLAGSCDALQTTCHELKKIYGRLNNYCEVFPNHILHIPREKPINRSDKVVIGWGGSHGHLEDIAKVAGPLIKWIITRPNVSLHLMCSDQIWGLFAPLPEHKKMRTLPGTIDDYYNFLKGIDIGIGPLNNTAFNRSRSDVKFLEYAASGVVPVMSRLGPYVNTVCIGKTGFLFKDTDELIDVLNRLSENALLIHEVSKTARQYVMSDRLQSQHAQDRLAFYRNRLEQLQGHKYLGENVFKSFEEWSQLKGVVRNDRHLQFRATRFEDLLHDGLVAMQATGDNKLAHRCFEEASMIRPDNYLPFLFGATASSDPVNSLRKALKLNSNSIKGWILLGEEFSKKGEIKEALESFNSASKLYPEYEIPYLRASELLNSLGKRPQSVCLHKKARELSVPFAFA